MTEETSDVAYKLPMTAERLLPHRPPMLFVDRLLERSGNRARAAATMPASGVCIDGDVYLDEFFIELVAQTMAMANGYDALCQGKTVNDGMLVAIDSFDFYTSAAPGSDLVIIIEKTFDYGPIKLIHGEVLDGDVKLVTGDLKVWENFG